MTPVALFRLLLSLYPSGFRERFAADMERAFAQEIQHARAAGVRARARLWILTPVHLLWGACVEHWVEWRRSPEVSNEEEWSAAARLRARRLVTKTTETGEPIVKSILADLRYAARTFLQRPGFTLVVVLTLGLGIGANTAIFSVVNGVLLRPLPFHEPDRLAFLWGRMTETSVERAPLSGPDVSDFQERADLLQGVAAVFSANSTIRGDYDAEQIRFGNATTNLFQVLGAQPVLGRAFAPEDQLNLPPSIFNDPNATPPPSVAIVSYDLWQRRYAGDPDILGKSVAVNGQPLTIVGVAPPGFRLYLPANAAMPGDVDVWAPIPVEWDTGPRDAQWLTVVARARDGATWDQVRAQMAGIATQLRQEHQFHSNVGFEVDVVPMHADVVSHVRPILLALLGAVGFVLLIACANVANLLLVRAQGRRQEIAVRRALGGGRHRIVRQLLTESAFLGAMGGVLGLLIAIGGVDLLLALRPENLPRADGVTIDGRVLAVVAGISVLATILSGAAPALQASGLNLADTLRTRRAGGRDSASGRLRSALVILEVAMSLVLLIGAGLMVRSFAALSSVEPGFRAENVLTANITPPFFELRTNAARVDFFNRVQESIRSVPGVVEVGGVAPLPLAGGSQLWFGPYALSESEEEWSKNEVDYRVILPGFFESVGAEMVSGRKLLSSDSEPDAEPVVLVDEKMARRAWPGENPLDKQILVMRPDSDATEFAWDRYWARVVGVVRHIRYDDLTVDSRETIYFPIRDWSFAELVLTIETSGDPASVAPLVRDAVADAHPEVALGAVIPFQDYVDDAMAPVRFALTLIGVFALVALALAIMGLYGVIAYSVSQRTREIGIRMAFGARGKGILKMVLHQGLRLAVVGAVVGIVGAFLLTRVLSSLLHGVTATDPVTYTGISVLLVMVALGASWLPARRATRIDPMKALRAE